MESSTGISFAPGTKCVCLNDEAGGLCGENLDRVSPKKMSSLPHRHIGAVISVGPAGSIQYGTGTLISRNLVLTCAHVIYNRQHEAYYPRILFYPALAGEMEIWHEVEEYEAPERYGERQTMYDTRSYDYALLKLKKPVSEEGFMELSDDPLEIAEDDTLSIYGYPVSKYELEAGKPVGSKQYGLTRKGYILDLII